MVVVVTGKNEHQVQQELQRLTSEFKNKHGDNIEKFDGVELSSSDDVLNAVRSISFLSPNKLVIVREFAQNKELLERLEEIVDQTADGTTLLLVDPKFDKRTSIYKKLQKEVQFKVFDESNAFELERWLVDKAKSYGSVLGHNEARLMIERLGTNQMSLDQELKKLALYSQKISVENILELTEQTPQSKIFDMLDALFQGQGERAWDIYTDQRLQGEEPQKVISMITWQLQQLTLAAFAPDSDKQTLISAGMSPYSARKSQSLVKNISRNNLKHYIIELAELDAQSKTNADVESALGVYFSDVVSRQATS